MKIRSEASLLLVIDVQERLHAAMPADPAFERNCAILLEAAGLLDVPAILTEQYPAGLGPTLAPLRGLASDAPVYEKMEFSCIANGRIRDALIGAERRSLILCGIEAHVCVLQTALDAIAAGFDVFVVADAVQSRHGHNRNLALDRLARSQAHIVSTEMVCFEWLGSADVPEFRSVSKLVR